MSDSPGKQDHTERKDTGSPSPGRLGLKARAWLIGLLVAALGTVITDFATGTISGGATAVWNTVSGKAEPQPPRALPPLTVSASVIRGRRSSFVCEQRRSELTPMSGSSAPEAALDRWVDRNGGADANTTAVNVVIEGRRQAAVILLEMTIEVLTRTPPPTGTLVGPAGAGGIGVRYFDVDLDEPSPTPVLGEQSESDDRPINFPYKVSLTDPEVFVLFASTHKSDCRWIARLHWRSAGKEGTTEIRDGGEPFRTASGHAAVDEINRFGQ